MCGESEREKLLVEGAVDGARKVPVEQVEGLHRAERGALGARSEVTSIALAALEQDDVFDDFGGRQAALGGVGEQGIEGLARCAEAEARAGRLRCRWSSCAPGAVVLAQVMRDDLGVGHVRARARERRAPACRLRGAASSQRSASAPGS